MMTSAIEIMKKILAKQACAIVDGLKMELDKRNIGSDTYQAKMVSEEVKRAHQRMYTKLSSITSKVNGRVVYDNPLFQDLYK